ncbi:hypothetical protein BKA64DRAFT_443123 [Cadophora sp. MPI-SDFR-AT-0126]|nr:hypothetical protein BKA64DRAFT_443123 [Leotiomycetes sp. MPI-SDFR-AT-0126]
MDAHALLTSQGWRGTGNSLHPTSNTIGLSRPLLVSKKVDNLGIGKKQHRTSDMWWMNAFDSSLKGLDTSKEGQVIQTVTSGGLDMVQKAGAKWVGSKGGLYASFVRGEGLGGTISPEESTGSESGKDVGNGGGGEKKRKRGGGEEESKEDRRARKAAKKAMKAERVELVMEESTPVGTDSDTKEERKARRAAKREGREIEEKVLEVEVASAPIKMTETKEQRRARRAAEREAKEQQSKAVEELSEDVEMADAQVSETKEEKKERRRLKKLAKEAQEKQESADDSSEKAKKKKRRKD